MAWGGPIHPMRSGGRERSKGDHRSPRSRAEGEPSTMSQTMRAAAAVIPRLTSATLGLLFSVAVAGKMWSPATGNTIIASIARAHPGVYASILAGEAILACWLMSFRARVLGLITAGIVLFFFGGVMLSELLQPKPRACGCFGFEAASPGNVSLELWVAAVRNVALATAACLAATLGLGAARTSRLAST